MNDDKLKLLQSQLQQKIIQLKIESNKMPEQRSNKWLEMRKFGFGGSEVASLLGINPYMKEKDLIRQKIGIVETKWNGNIYTRWGVVQEENTKRFIELIFNMNIEEINILKGAIDGQLYSPDGIGVVNLRYFDYEMSKALNKYFYTLFEFKAPFCRIPSGIIPKEYMPQIQSGLSVIDDIDNALFVNALYRMCSLTQFGLNNSYNINFHSSDKNKNYKPDSNPIALGIIVIYQNNESKKKFKEFYEKYEHDKDVVSDESDYDDAFDDVSDNGDIFDNDVAFDDVNDNGDGNNSDNESETDPDDSDIVKKNVSSCDRDIDNEYDFNMICIDQILKYPPAISNIEIQQFKTKNINNINEILSTSYNYNSKTFQSAIKLPYEMDFGDTKNDIVHRLFELITNNNENKYVSSLKIDYLDPFIVRKNLEKIEFMNSQNIITDEDKIDEITLNKNIHKFFVNQISQSRIRLEEHSDCEIIGFIPWKLFDCDVILVNRDMECITNIQSKITESIKILNEIHKASDEKKYELFNKYYK